MALPFCSTAARRKSELVCRLGLAYQKLSTSCFKAANATSLSFCRSLLTRFSSLPHFLTASNAAVLSRMISVRDEAILCAWRFSSVNHRHTYIPCVPVQAPLRKAHSRQTRCGLTGRKLSLQLFSGIVFVYTSCCARNRPDRALVFIRMHVESSSHTGRTLVTHCRR